MEPYVYTPITKPGDIRLIQLEPSPDKAAAIKCCLIHTTLTQVQGDVIDNYTALSYVWGDPKQRVTISVDGKSLAVTKSLESALVHLRDTTRIFNVWADGICIDQDSNEEKEIQVQQMGEVYESATHTIIFLGPATEASDLWLKMVENIPKSYNLGVGLDRLRTILDAEDRESFPDSQSFVQALAEALSHILSRPWFYRVWIFQELLLSRDPRIQCGEYRCTWDHFYTTACLFSFEIERQQPALSCPTKLKDGGSTGGRSPILDNCKPLDVLRSMHKARINYLSSAIPVEVTKTTKESIHVDLHAKAMESLLAILKSRRGFGVYDPRDMLFAHFGIVKDGGTSIINQVVLNYSYDQDPATIYNDFARKQIETIGYSYLLSLDDRDPDSPHIPGLRSWAPDWTVAPTLDNSLFDYGTNIYERLQDPSVKEFQSRRIWTNNPDLLCTSGSVLFDVVDVSPIMPQLTTVDPVAKNQYRPWWDLLNSAQITLLEHERQMWVQDSCKTDTLDLPNFGPIQVFRNFDSPFAEREFALYLSGRHDKSASVAGRRVAIVKEVESGSFQLALVPASTKVGDKIISPWESHYLFVAREIDAVPDNIEHTVEATFGKEFDIWHCKIVGICWVNCCSGAGLLFEQMINRMGKKLWLILH